MSYRRKKEINGLLIGFIIYLVALVVDIALVFVMKDGAPKNRWLWLPLISLGLAMVAGVGMMDRDLVLIKILSIAWGIIRGIIVVAAYFNATSGFWATVGAIFLCMFMFLFNAASFIMAGAMMNQSGESSGPSTSGPRSNPSYDPPPRRRDEGVKSSSRPRQGNLESYFSSYACAPQSGSMYFWHSSPSMSSSFGSPSNYTISGTIGIKRQSVEAFHVTSTDMDHHLRSVNDDIKRYAQEIMSRYHRDYPDDDTEFCIDIDLHLTVVDW